FAIAHDADGSRFRFASLDSEGFRRRVPAASRAGLPDSIVALTPDGTLLVRSAAVMHVLERVGGGWKVVGRLLRLGPRAARRAGYGAVARVSYWLFPRATCAGPGTPPGPRARLQG